MVALFHEHVGRQDSKINAYLLHLGPEESDKYDELKQVVSEGRSPWVVKWHHSTLSGLSVSDLGRGMDFLDKGTGRNREGMYSFATIEELNKLLKSLPTPSLPPVSF